MIAYECESTLMEDGHLSIPDNIRKKIEKSGVVRIRIMVEEDAAASTGKLSSIFMDSPLCDSGIDLERRDDYGREIVV